MRKSLILLIVLTFIYSQSALPLSELSQLTPNEAEEGARSPSGPSSEKGEEGEFEAQSQDADSLSTAPYLIESGDLLEIVILGEEELSRTLMVMHNGTISFPLIGEVKISGLTIDEASLLVAGKLKKYFAHPVVSVILKSPTLPYVSVFGEVLKQGAVEYQRGLRVTDYVALAGGPTDKANLGRVKVVRFVKGVPVATTIDMDKVLAQGDLTRNYELKAGDWVHVSRKFSINWSLVIQTLTLAATITNLYFTIQHYNE